MFQSELSREPDSKLLEGSRLISELEDESEESKEEGGRVEVMYPKVASRRDATDGPTAM
jgi:hypothetical protein